ncbi:restriction endonuclease subunit S [Tropicibacter alexandrii]|uniref:restriction endonuclease subunit S n=1 Tax=Tropicibacter alexandrii TaxID=2267683 RepID=UPI000EF4A3F8|nr:restriction endonuclease subunit S [Tropicibacter alexandrii]
MTEIPKGWMISPLGDVMDVQGGSQPPKSNFKYEPEEGYVRLLQIRDYGEKPVPTFVPKNMVTKFCAKDDVLIARYGASLGRILTGMEGAYNVALAKTIFSRDLFNSRYIFWLLKTEVLQTPLKMISRSAQNGFARHEIAHVELPIPPVNEQRRIVERIEAMFDEIDHGVENLKKAKATLGLYRQSLLKSAFEGHLTADWRARNADKLETPETLLARLEVERDTWHKAEFQRWQDDVAQWEDRGEKGPKPRKPEAYKSGAALAEEELSVLPDLPPEWLFVRLNDIAYIGSGMSVSKSRKHEDPVEIPYLRVANVQRGFLELDEIKAMPIERSQLAGLQLREWDILFNEGGDRDKLGRGWIWEMQVDLCITQNHVFRGTPFRTDKDWSIYISQWGNSYGRGYFETGGKQTTNLASINKTVLKALPVPICSPEEQAEITRILDERLSAADALEAEIDAGLTRAEALRQSILKQAFSGKLVPQDPKDEPAATLLARIKAEKATKPKRQRKRA